MKSFNVIIATTLRPTLSMLLESIAPQLNSNDYITIISDVNSEIPSVSTKATVIKIVNSETLGFWGHGSRTKWQNFLPGDYYMNADDDDVYEPEIMDHVRNTCTEHKLYIYKMRYGNNQIWSRPVIEFANIGTPCGIYPSDVLHPEWKKEYGGDYYFYQKLSELIPYEFVDKVIYSIKNA